MSAPKVNVLAVMDRQLEFTVASDYSGASQDHRDLVAARAAVAELIRAANAIDVAITCGKHEERINRSNPLSVETLRGALARIGGAA